MVVDWILALSFGIILMGFGNFRFLLLLLLLLDEDEEDEEESPFTVLNS